jgi:hypothetical protein
MGIKLLTFTIMFSWITNGFSQNPQPDVSEFNRNNFKKALAVWQIENLKNGVLIVRLSTKYQTIRALVSAGHDERAKQVEKELELYNASIIQGFKATFDFCNVYFFESQYSERVLEGKYDRITFVDSLIIDEAIDLKTENTPVFVAEFSSLQPDTVQDKSGNRQAANTNLGISALIIKSDQFIQLMDPFPYYVREYKGMIGIDREPPKAIAKMNEKLHAFYLKKDEITIKKRKRR